MNKKTLLFLGLFSISGLFLSAQKNNNNPRNFGNSIFYEQIKEQAQENNGKVLCAAYEYDQYLNSIYPKKETIDQFESWLAPKIEQYKRRRQTMKVTNEADVITIPVVVHVVHNNKAYGVDENITDEQILSQITVLNQDFRKMLDTPGYNTNIVGADIEVEFCLARRTPDNQPTNGINRLNIPTPTFSFFGLEFTSWTMDVIDEDLKPTTIWDTDNYLNIWIVDNIFMGSITGYAQFPVSSGLDGFDVEGLNTTANTDGVVIGHYAFGSSDIYPEGTYEAPYDKGRTATHEVGHWLGLRHIWGDQASCEVDATDSFNDFCLDTPPSSIQNSGCSQSSVCTTQSMLENYMDYTDDSCKNIFTEDQKIRMRTVLENSPRRNTMINSLSCVALNDFDAQIDILNLGELCDFEATPLLKLSNMGGETTITSVEISYTIEGGNSETHNWTGNLGAGDFTYITLSSVVFTEESDFEVNLVSVNGIMDDYTDNNSDSATKVLPSEYSGTTVVLSLTTDDYGDETTWELINSNTGAVVYQGGNYGNNQTTTQTFELTAGDCYTFTIYDEYADGICCFNGNGSYSLTVGSEVIVSGGSFGSKESTSFVISSTASIDTKNIFDHVMLYPNPTNSLLNVVVGTSDLPEQILIYNMLGQVVKNQSVNDSNDLSVDVSSFANGVYLIKIAGKGQSKTMRFIKQ